jgi:beta-lactamase class D
MKEMKPALMSGHLRLLLMAVILWLPFQSHAAEWHENSAVSELFRSAGVNGTFVVYDVKAQTFAGHDNTRAGKRFSPASTFKIPNSLIGLSVGAVASVDEILPYKGPPEPFIKAWAKDMGLREAIALSNVPIYQELARRIGLDRMQIGIDLIGYGNQEIGDSVDSFWLTGPLRISAMEQCQFLAKLAQQKLPFPMEAQRSVRDILLTEEGIDWKLFSKTGWQNAPGQGVGWWVGWLEKDQFIYAFALNIDIQEEADAGKRIGLGKAGLKILGLL